MYTEDDKYKKPKFKFNKYQNNKIKKTSTMKNNNSEEIEDYYKDYYDNYSETSLNKQNNQSSNQELFNNFELPYNNDNYSSFETYDKNTLSKKKYVVIIIILFIILSILIVFLIQTINVKAPPIGSNANYVRLYQEELELKPGDTKKLELILSDTKDENYKIEWFSNNDNVVAVDKNGNIIAINKGEAIILVAYYLNNKVYDAQCRIYVS